MECCIPALLGKAPARGAPETHGTAPIKPGETAVWTPAPRGGLFA